MEQEDYTIRLMREDDIEQIALLEDRLFVDPWPKQNFSDELKNGKKSFSYVIESERQIIAYLVAWCYADEIHIGNIAVVPAYRRRGLARKLLDYIVKVCDGCNELFLEVRESNLAAIALYDKIGFKVLGVRRSYYKDGENALVMKKTRTG
jgi:ribosomal-protein-alanine N-acetyltransferase